MMLQALTLTEKNVDSNNRYVCFKCAEVYRLAGKTHSHSGFFYLPQSI